MRILLTNDDGVNAPGLKVLEAIARTLSDDIWIVAPAEENSGAGHSLTLTKPVRIRQHGEKHYSVAGTPTDSVMLGIGVIMKDAKPDLILIDDDGYTEELMIHPKIRAVMQPYEPIGHASGITIWGRSRARA